MLYILHALFNCCINCCECSRRISNKLGRSLYYSYLLRMVLESFLVGYICCMLNLRVIDFTVEADMWTRANEIATLVIFLMYIIFPIGGCIFLYRNFRLLRTPVFVQKYGELTTGLSLKKKSMITFWGLDLLRKALLTFVLVYKHDSLPHQIFTLFMTSTVLLIAIGHTSARKNNYDRRMDMFNEIKLIVI